MAKTRKKTRAAERVKKKAAAARRAASHASAKAPGRSAKPSAKKFRAPKKAAAKARSLAAAERRADLAARRKAKAAAPRKSAVKASAANGLPKPSTKPFGQAGKALDGVRILDFTHVQSGPTCTQLLGYMGADCIKVERPGVGDITRGQLRDVKGQDSLYFTMLNGNKRSITIDFEASQGQGDPRAADQALRRAGGEFRARRARPHGADLGVHPQDQPAHDRRLGEGLRSRPRTRTARSTRTSRSARAAQLRPPASAMARRW